MKKIFVFIFLLFATQVGNAQQLHITYTRMIGGTGGEEANDAIYDERDKSIVFTGLTGDSCGTGDLPPCPPVTGRSDLIVGKLDSNRNLVWLREYGGSGDEDGKNCQIIASFDGYLIYGASTSTDGDVTNSYGNDAWLLKVNNVGQLLWQKSYGSINGSEIGKSCIVTNDKGILMIGTSTGSGQDVPFQYVNSPFTTDWFIVKTDSLGNKTWAKTIGGTGNEYWAGIFQIGGNYYVAGYSSSHDHECDDESWHTGHNNTGGDYFLIKLDSAGNYLWNKSYGGTGDDQMEDAIYDERDSSFVMVGHTTSTDYMVPYYPTPRQDILVIKVDLNGNFKWSKIFGDNSNEWMCHVRKSSINNGYLVTCRADLNNPIPSYYYGGGSDNRLFLIDSSGGLIADKVIGGNLFENSCVAIAINKGFAVAGSTMSLSFPEGVTSPAHGINGDAYVSYLDFWSASVSTTPNEQEQLKVYPNPADNKITIELINNSKGTLSISDVSGKLVWHQKVKDAKGKLEINTANWQRGVYIIQWIDQTGKEESKKIILQ